MNTPGAIESYLHVSHLKTTRYSHEVTSVVLYGLLMDAFEISDYIELEDYREDMKKMSLSSASLALVQYSAFRNHSPGLSKIAANRRPKLIHQCLAEHKSMVVYPRPHTLVQMAPNAYC